VRCGADPAAQREQRRQAPTVAELAADYLQEHLIPKARASTVKEWGRLLDRIILPRLGSRKVEDVTAVDVENLHRALRATPVTANRVVTLLSALMMHAERRHLRPPGSSPCRWIEKYPEKKRERFLTSAGMARLGDALAEAERDGSELPSAILAIRLLALTGMRRGEVLGLRWEYVDLERGLLSLPDSKTGPKAIQISDSVLELLARAPRLEDNPYVIFGERRGAPLVGIQKAWRRLLRRAGLDRLRLHDLRHSYASFGAAAGLGLFMIGKLLGHHQASTTQRYAHLADDPARMAANRVSGDIAAALLGPAPSSSAGPA
jgi:integrase